MSAPVYVGKHIAKWHREHCVCCYCTRDGLPKHEAADFAEQFGFQSGHLTPVVFSSPSAAATVKAGGVATTNDIGDDTTQPDKAQR